MYLLLKDKKLKNRFNYLTSRGIEQTVQREIKEYEVLHKIESKPEWVIKDDFMNNFYGYFTDENCGYSPRASFRRDGWETTNRDWLRENYRDNPESLQRNLKAYSELYLSQTGRQLIESIDQAVLEIGIDPVELKFLATKMGDKLVGEERRDFIERIMFPLYLKLREKGYNHKELAR